MAVDFSERQALLDTEIAKATAAGWVVESRGATQAVLVKGKKTQHVLHLLLSIVTGGLWLIVWFFLAQRLRQRRQITIEADGTVLVQGLKA